MQNSIEKLIKSMPKWVLLALGILGMIFVGWGKLSVGGEEKHTPTEHDYEQTMVSRMKTILSSVEGVGRLDVMVTLSEGYGYDYVRENRQNINTTEDLTESKSGRVQQRTETEEKYVLADSTKGKTPVVMREYTPVIQGIVVVCEGGANPEVIVRVVDAATVALGVRASQVSVLPMVQGTATEPENILN